MLPWRRPTRVVRREKTEVLSPRLFSDVRACDVLVLHIWPPALHICCYPFHPLIACAQAALHTGSGSANKDSRTTVWSPGLKTRGIPRWSPATHQAQTSESTVQLPITPQVKDWPQPRALPSLVNKVSNFKQGPSLCQRPRPPVSIRFSFKGLSSRPPIARYAIQTPEVRWHVDMASWCWVCLGAATRVLHTNGKYTHGHGQADETASKTNMDHG